MTCILSQWKELHYRKIFQQLQNQISIPADKEQFNFFRKRADLFVIANNGYVKICNFPDFEVNSTIFSGFFQTKTVVENVTLNLEKSKKSLQNGENFSSELKTHKKESDCSRNVAPNLTITSNTEDEILKLRPGENHIVKNSSSEQLKMHDACKKVKDAIYFLLNYFKLISDPSLVCVILHALKDVSIYFANLNISDQDTFLKKSLSGFHTDSNGQISKVFYLSLQFNLSNNEKDLLFLCFILSQKHDMHCQEIFDTYAQYHRAKPISVVTCSDMHKYFLERTDLFSLNSDGYVKMNLQFAIGENAKILHINNISPNSIIRKSPLLNTGTFKNIQIKQQSKICELKYNEDSNIQSQQTDLEHSVSLELKCERYKESVAIINNQFDRIVSDCADVIILHILSDLRELDHSKREQLLSTTDEDTKNYIPVSSKSLLNEEEKDLLIIASTLVQSGPLHHCKLFELLRKQNRDSLKILTEPEQYQYILQKSEFLNITSDGIVSFNAISNKDIENCYSFSPANEAHFKISLSKIISTENDLCCDKLIDSFIKNISTGKREIKPNRISKKILPEPTFNLLEIIPEESSSCTTSFHHIADSFNLTEFSDAPKTKLELQCVNFFATLLTNYKMVNSLKAYLYLASEEIQNHLKDCYNDNINHFLEIHQMNPPSF